MTHDDLLSNAFKNLDSLGLKKEDIVKDGEITLKSRMAGQHIQQQHLKEERKLMKAKYK